MYGRGEKNMSDEMKPENNGQTSEESEEERRKREEEERIKQRTEFFLKNPEALNEALKNDVLRMKSLLESKKQSLDNERLGSMLDRGGDYDAQSVNTGAVGSLEEEARSYERQIKILESLAPAKKRKKKKK